MLTKQICLVLGAGASQPYSFPTGGQLMELIQGTQPDEWWPLAKAVTGFDKGDHEEFVKRLRISDVPSIDQFAGGNPESEKYPKALIAQFVGRMEISSNVLRNQRAVDWVSYLKHRIAHDVRQFAALKTKWPHVITFNYDRSFEESMLQRLVHTFHDAYATPGLVAKLLRQWQIVHVHGSLGDHPAFTEDGSGRPFAPTLEPAALEAAISRIILVHDAKADSDEFTRARALIQESELVFFLGFAFDPDNLEKLLPEASPDPIPSLFATVFDDAKSAIRAASARPHRRVVLNGNYTNCKALLEENSGSYSV
jgi:hypothetical protein